MQKPIRSEEVRRFFENYPAKDFNTYLRMNWLFDLPTNEDLILGQGRWEKVNEAFNAKITGRSCVKNALEKLLRE